MTITLIGRPTAPTPSTARSESVPALRGAALLAVLREVVSASADLDPDLLHSTLPAGRAAIRLATAARADAAASGIDAGTPLTAGPGIVVMREMVSALTLLASAVDAETLGPDPVLALPGDLLEAYRTFLEAV